jgi:hypothetical protein
VVGFPQRLVHVAELERLQPVDVAALAVVVDARGLRGEYFTSIRSSASNAVSSSRAITAATGSPT